MHPLFAIVRVIHIQYFVIYSVNCFECEMVLSLTLRLNGTQFLSVDSCYVLSLTNCLNTPQILSDIKDTCLK